MCNSYIFQQPGKPASPDNSKSISIKLVTILCVFLLFQINAQAQDEGTFEIGFSSPQAASLGTYGENNVDLTRGIARQSIPIYTVSIGDLSLPISLNYSSSGVKVKAVNSWTGIDWTVFAGGVISRNKRGNVDEEQYGYINTANNSCFKSGGGPCSSGSTEGAVFPKAVVDGHIDPEPDEFNYNFGPYSGRFLFDGNGNVYSQPYTSLKIVPTFSGYTITQFKVYNKQGVEYVFSEIEQYRNQNDPTSPQYTSAWYLTQINSPSGSHQITITYQEFDSKSTNIYYTKKIGNNPATQDQSTSYYYDVKVPHIITAGELKVEFIKDSGALTGSTVDPREHWLKEIRIYEDDNSASPMASFKFEYTGVERGDEDIFFLTRFYRTNGSSQINEFEFEYYNLSLLSDINRQEIDHWGYYNDNGSSSEYLPRILVDLGSTHWYYPGVSRSVNTGTVHYGMLKKITYPTGGHSEYTYEPNEYGSVVFGGGSLEEYQSGSSTANLTSYTCPTGFSTCKKGTYSYAASGYKYVRSAITMDWLYDGPTPAVSDVVEVQIYKNGTQIHASGPLQMYHPNRPQTTSWTYQLYVKARSSDSFEVRVQTNFNHPIDFTFNTSDFLNKSVSKKYGPGVRISQIKTHDGMTTQNDIIREYDYNNCPGNSCGLILTEPEYYYSFNPSTRPSTDIHRAVTPAQPVLSFNALVSTPSAPFGSANTEMAVYSKVRVNHGVNAEHGYEESEFSTNAYVSPTEPGGVFRTASNVSAQMGNLKTHKVYEKVGSSYELKRKVEHDYTYYVTDDDADYAQTFNALGLIKFDDYNYKQYWYEIYLSWVEKKWEKITTYENGQSFYTQKEYTYIKGNKLPRTVTETNSLTTEKRVTEYAYAHEQSGSPNYSAMKSLNMLSQPYSVELRNASDTETESKTWTSWSNGFSGISKWLPDQQWLWSGTGSAPYHFAGAPTIELVDAIAYDVKGNPLEVQDANNVSTAYDWSADGTTLIGIFQNAGKDQVFAHSFAFDGLTSWGKVDENEDNDFSATIDGEKLRLYHVGATSSADYGERDRVYYDMGTEVTSDVIIEFDVRIANSNSWDLQINAGGNQWDTKAFSAETAIWSSINDEAWKAHNGSSWVPIISGLIVGKTYTFKIVAHPAINKADYYVNGKKVASNIRFKTSSTGIQKIAFGRYGYSTLNATWYLDNVRIYPEAALAQSQEVDSTFGTVVAFKDASGATTRYSYDTFSRLDEVYNANGSLTTTYDYYYSLENNSNFNSSQPNRVETVTYTNPTNSSITIKGQSYLDGLGREIQTQQRGGTKVIVAETLYNTRGLQEAVSRPIEENATGGFTGFYTQGLMSGGGSFTPGSALPASAPVYNYYLNTIGNTVVDTEFAYSQILHEPSPMARISKSTLPGDSLEMDQGKEIETNYGLNTHTNEKFTFYDGQGSEYTWPQNKLSKVVTIDPTEKKTITYTDGWGRVIASGVDMDNDSRLDGSKKSSCTGSTCDLITEFEYDISGNLVRIEDPEGMVTTYTYNKLNQLVEKKLPDQNHSHQYMYDNKGRLRFHKDPYLTVQGTFYYTKYDEFDRPTSFGTYDLITSGFTSANANTANWPGTNHTPLIYYYYNGNETNPISEARNLKGRLSQVSYRDNGSGSYGYTWYSYNELGLLEWIEHDMPGSQPGNVKISYKYDHLGRMTELWFEENSYRLYTWYEYDVFGRLEKVYTNELNNVSTRTLEAQYTYFADGQVRKLVLGGGAQTLDYTYTVQGWLETINNGTTLSGGDVFGMQLSYTKSGNIRRQDWNTPFLGAAATSYDYHYDTANRLTKACFDGATCASGNYDVTYNYDRNGNFTSLNRIADGTDPNHNFTYTYYTDSNSKPTNRVKSINGGSSTNFTYDANGNMKTNTVQGITATTYGWRNLPLSMTAGSSSLSYSYDHEGNRIRKSLSGGATSYYVRGVDGQTIAVYDGNGDIQFFNILAGGQIIGQLSKN